MKTLPHHDYTQTPNVILEALIFRLHFELRLGNPGAESKYREAVRESDEREAVSSTAGETWR